MRELGSKATDKEAICMQNYLQTKLIEILLALFKVDLRAFIDLYCHCFSVESLQLHPEHPRTADS